MGEVVAAYVAARADKISARQIAGHCRAPAASLGWLKVAALKGSHVRSYVRQRLAKGMAPGTVREELSKLRAALRWGASEGLCAPVELRIPVGGEPRERWLTREECARLLDGAREPHVRLYILILLNTGARPSAALELTWDRVDLARRTVDLGRKPGGKRRAVVPMTATLEAALAEAREAATTTHVIEYGGRPVRWPRRGFGNAVRRAGIAPCTRHDMRRTAGSLMLQEGVPIEMVAAFLGHRSITTTLRVYARLAVDHLRGAAEALDSARA